MYQAVVPLLLGCSKPAATVALGENFARHFNHWAKKRWRRPRSRMATGSSSGKGAGKPLDQQLLHARTSLLVLRLQLHAQALLRLTLVSGISCTVTEPSGAFKL